MSQASSYFNNFAFFFLTLPGIKMIFGFSLTFVNSFLVSFLMELATALVVFNFLYSYI